MPKQQQQRGHSDTSLVSEKKKKKLSLHIPTLPIPVDPSSLPAPPRPAVPVDPSSLPTAPRPPGPADPSSLQPILEISLTCHIKLVVLPHRISISDGTKPAENTIHLTPEGWGQFKQGVHQISMVRLMNSVAEPIEAEDTDDVKRPHQLEPVHLGEDIYLTQSYYNGHYFVQLKHFMIYSEGGRRFPTRLGLTFNEPTYYVVTDSSVTEAVDEYLIKNPNTHIKMETRPMRPLDKITLEKLQQLWLSCYDKYFTPILIALRQQHCGACNHIIGVTDHTCRGLEIMTIPGFIPNLPEALMRVDEDRVRQLFQRRVAEVNLTSAANASVFYNRFATRGCNRDFEKIFSAYLESQNELSAAIDAQLELAATQVNF